MIAEGPPEHVAKTAGSYTGEFLAPMLAGATVTDDDAWETHAQWWQDEFTDGADPEYVEQILPIVASELGDRHQVLDIGTGEGQLARHLRASGVERVTGIDPSVNQLAHRRSRAAADRSTHGPPRPRCRSRTPRSTACVACLVFEHIEAVDEAIAEVARVLAPGGVFLFLLNHPLLQVPGSGWIDDHILEEQYWRIGPYLTESLEEEEIAPGVTLPFIHRPMSRYVNSMAGQRAARSTGCSSPRHPRVSWPGRSSTRSRRRSRGCSSCARSVTELTLRPEARKCRCSGTCGGPRASSCCSAPSVPSSGWPRSTRSRTATTSPTPAGSAGRAPTWS